MQLEKQVTSLEISKQLKDLGVKQESLFYWVLIHSEHDYQLASVKNFPVLDERMDCMNVPGCYRCEEIESVIEIYSAFTVAELGEIIGWKLLCAFEFPRDLLDKFIMKSDSEADCRGKIVIELVGRLENKEWKEKWLEVKN